MGVLFIIIMLGVGTTYASSDAGAAISTWFHHSFIEHSNEIEDVTANEINTSLKRLSIDIQNAAQNAEEEILDFQLRMTAGSERTIDEHYDHYIKQLQAIKENLKKQNEQEMLSYKEQIRAREEAQITNDAEAILAELLENQN